METGSELSEEKVGEGIKRAFRKGIFAKISVEADEAVEGLVIIRVKERKFVDEIEIEGRRHVKKDFIKENLSNKEGNVFRPDLFEADRRKILDLLKKKGFPAADLNFQVEDEGPSMVKVIVKLNEGNPVRIKNIKVAGRPPEGIVLPMRLHIGDIYDEFHLREWVERVEEFLKDMGYLDPDVGPHTFDDGILTLNVDPGERLLIGFKGNDSISDKDLLEVMPFYMEGGVRTDLIDEAVRDILDVYHGRGYPFAQVAPIVSLEDDGRHVDFYIYEGNKILVDYVRLVGTSLPEKRLKEIMSVRERKVYNLEQVHSDIQKLREFYLALGYKNVELMEPEVSISDEWARIEIHVKEGQRFEYSEISVMGAGAYDMSEYFGALRIKKGDPYNEVDILDTRRDMTKICRRNGYPDCVVETQREFDAGGVRVVFKVYTGDQKVFGKTIVSGNLSTKTRVIQRELEYREGIPLDTSRLVETRQNLYKLGLFSEVKITTIEREGYVEDVLVEVQEAKPGALEFGFGYSEYENIRGFVDISHRNLFGLDRRASLRAEVSSLYTRYILNYTEPWFLDRNLVAKSYVLREDRKEENIDTGELRYRVKKHSAGFGVEKQLTRTIKADLTYKYSIVETFDVDPDVILSKEDTGTLAISSITPSIAYDTRDNPFDPQRGSFTGLSVKTAASVLASETDFVKATAHISGYERANRWLILAISLRGGIAQGFNETEELPLVERFFLGGRNSVRGFDQDELGPKGEDGNPTGGNAFVSGSFELRVRVMGNWRLVPFMDGGGVWIEPEDFDIDELRYTAGIGLQYNTPVGPIRIDYGHKIDREPDESRGEVHFSIGHAF
jgi:outer membrane protein insertion porin family